MTMGKAAPAAGAAGGVRMHETQNLGGGGGLVTPRSNAKHFPFSSFFILKHHGILVVGTKRT